MSKNDECQCVRLDYYAHTAIAQGRREGGSQGFQETPYIFGHTIKARNLVRHINA